MKKKFVLKTLLSLFIAFAIAFGAYQIFFDNAEALNWTCGSNSGCDLGLQCGGTLRCTCQGAPPVMYCWVPPLN